MALERLIHTRITQELASGADQRSSAHRLNAVEQFRRRRDAGVAPRVALETLMLEL
jgi:hypothetical protein